MDVARAVTGSTMSSVVKTQKDLLEVFHDVFHSLQLSTDIVHGRHIEFRFKITAHPGQKERERIRNSLATSLSKAPAWVSMSVHAVAMSSSHSVVSAEVDHPGATNCAAVSLYTPIKVIIIKKKSRRIWHICKHTVLISGLTDYHITN